MQMEAIINAYQTAPVPHRGKGLTACVWQVSS
jgi:hypothetical protein